MNHVGKSFSQVFERYLYKVANQTIDLAYPATQTEMINLLTEVSRVAETTEQGIIQSELSEWGQILLKPVDWRSVHQQWLLEIHRARQERTMRYIQRLEGVIATTYLRYQQVKMSFLSEPRRSRLVSYYEEALAGYKQHLVQVLATNKAN
ncbi:hypothetical protein GCM10027592_04190 [Spirosoma flavus]